MKYSLFTFLIAMMLPGLSIGQGENDPVSELLEKIDGLTAYQSAYKAEPLEGNDCGLFFQITYEDESYESTTFSFSDLDVESQRIEKGTYEGEWRFVILTKGAQMDRLKSVKKNDNGRRKTSFIVDLYSYDKNALEGIQKLFLKAIDLCKT